MAVLAQTRRSGRRGLPAAVLLAVLPLLVACGSASPTYPPTGVDDLVIPTPDVDPHDFVTGIDNRWLPLEQGASWTYDVTGQTVSGGVGTMTVTVVPGTTSVDGVAATAVRTRVVGVSASDEQVDYYAQDQVGNVWWFGRAGQWRAGDDGAQAGLAMPAHPRYGDGWREAYSPGVVEDRAEVTDVDDAFSVDDHRFAHVLDLTVSSDLSPGISAERSYAAGVGLVRSYAPDGPAELVELVELVSGR